MRFGVDRRSRGGLAPRGVAVPEGAEGDAELPSWVPVLPASQLCHGRVAVWGPGLNLNEILLPSPPGDPGPWRCSHKEAAVRARLSNT